VMVPVSELLMVPELTMPAPLVFDIVMMPELLMIPLGLKMPALLPVFDIVMVPELVLSMVPPLLRMPTPSGF